MDLKVIPRSYKGHKYILCIIDEVTNYLITVPIHQAKSEEIGNALIKKIINTVHHIHNYTSNNEKLFAGQQDIMLMDKEKKEVIYMLYKYKESFSLRNEIGTCPNIEVEIDVMDKSPFFIRPYHVKEEDKAFTDTQIKCLFYLGILKEGFSAYSSPVMLISRKVTQDKRVVTDFRHLNVRIAKNNLAYPLLKDAFSVLGSSRCKALSVLDLKDAFHSLRLLENSKRYCRILP